MRPGSGKYHKRESRASGTEPLALASFMVTAHGTVSLDCEAEDRA